MEKIYREPHTLDPVSEELLKAYDPDAQKGVMREWFFDNYEDPVHRTPYESREGGYQYIYGGPYQAINELSSEFSGNVPDHIIDELADELNEICWDWTGAESERDYDDFYSELILSNTKSHESFLANLEKTAALLETDIPEVAQQHFYRLLYASVITVLETYLSDTFMHEVMSDEKLLQKFVETNPDFTKEKFTLSQVFEKADTINKTVESYLLKILWHNLAKVRPLYENTFGVKFPEKMGALIGAVLIRHDIVHRNGKTKGGKDIHLSKDDVVELILEARQFADFVDDNPISDIQGAHGAGIDQVFFNPLAKTIDLTPTYTISHLRELEEIL